MKEAGGGERPPLVAAPSPRANLMGALLLIGAALLFTFEAMLLRYLDTRVSTGQIMMFRALGHTVIVGFYVLAREGPSILRTEHLGLHVLRGILSAASWACFYYSFVYLDLALSTTLTFTASLFVVALAGPFLGERVGKVSIYATIIGFIGIAIMTGVTPQSFQPMAVLGLLAALFSGGIIMMNRVLVRSERTITIMVYIGIMACLIAAPAAIFTWNPLSGGDFFVGCVIGVFGTLGMFLNIEAYRYGEPAKLAPYPYIRIIFAVAAGYVIFAEVPTLRTLVGAMVIMSAVLVVTHFELTRDRAALANPPARERV